MDTCAADILADIKKNVYSYYNDAKPQVIWYPMFYQGTDAEGRNHAWLKQNYIDFLKNTPNEILYHRWYPSELGYITAAQYAPKGSYIIVGYSTGLVQVDYLNI